MEVPTKVSGRNPAIGVLLSDSYSDVFKNFRCAVCGKIVFSYNNEEIRMVLASGSPVTLRPQKVIECQGTLALHTPNDLYFVLHKILDVIYDTEDVAAIREVIQEAALIQDSERTIKCKARYYVS